MTGKVILACVLLFFFTAFAREKRPKKSDVYNTIIERDSIDYYKAQSKMFLSLAKLRVDSSLARIKILNQK